MKGDDHLNVRVLLNRRQGRLKNVDLLSDAVVDTRGVVVVGGGFVDAVVVDVEKVPDGRFLEVGGREVSAFDGDVAQQPLLVGLLQDVLLHRPLADQPVNVDVASLADTMAPIL